jgi:mRNA interferase MazF
MITSAENRACPGDVVIANHERAGLPAPSVVRPIKVATIEARSAERLGKIAKPTLRSVMRQIEVTLSEGCID